jgi:excinuclease ABC subunit A
MAILGYPEGSKIQLLAPVVKHEKGTQKDTLAKLKAQGFARLRVDGEFKLLDEVGDLDKNKRHDIDLVMDRLIVKDGIRSGWPKRWSWPSIGAMASS